MELNKAQKGTIALKNVFVKKYGVGSFGIYCDRNVRGSNKKSIHAEGRAWDCKVNALEGEGLNIGNKIYFELQSKYIELGIEKIIWNRKVWTPEAGEVDYVGVNPHTDHLHIEQSVEKASTLSKQDIMQIV